MMAQVQDTSLMAYLDNLSKKETQKKKIMSVCNEWGKQSVIFTRKMISVATGIPMHVVAPRVLELLTEYPYALKQDYDEDMKALKVYCPVSKKMVNALRVKKDRPSPLLQQSLFEEVVH